MMSVNICPSKLHCTIFQVFFFYSSIGNYYLTRWKKHQVTSHYLRRDQVALIGVNNKKKNRNKQLHHKTMILIKIHNVRIYIMNLHPKIVRVCMLEA